MSKFRIGRHIGINQQFVNTPLYAKSLGYNIFQIFLSVPQKVLSKARQGEVLFQMGKELEKYDIKMVVHGSYTINLCHSKKTSRYNASIKSLVQDLNSTVDIGKNCLGVIIHMGKNIPENKLTDDQALNNYVIGLKDALHQTPDNTCIILETGASQGSEIASELDGLAEIYWKLTDNEKMRIMFCIDTCHIWATGYDISDAVGVKRFFKEFNDKIGLKKIACIHFNDSKTGLQSYVDRHADLGYGFIKSFGLQEVAQFAKKNNIPLVMETPLESVNTKTNKEITAEEELKMVKLWIKNLKI
jgi:deoxyribonuclease-4